MNNIIDYEFNTIEDCMNIIERRNDVPYEIKTEIEDIWFDILMDENYEDDFRIEKAIRKLNDFINMEKGEKENE